MRRLIIVEPVSQAALWCRRFALFGIALALIAVGASRSGAVEPPAALAILAAALLSALLVFPTALVAAAVIWRTGRPGIGAILGGLTLALLLLAYPVYLATKASNVTAVSDISTDPANPVAFSRSAKAVAARRGRQHEAPAPALIRLQASAYPEIKPLDLDASAEDAYKAVLHLVVQRHWHLVETQAPAGRPAAGRIEVVARSPVMGFADDVAIRIAATGAATCRVDLRSTSRFDPADLGANAARVKALATDIEAAFDTE